MKAQTLLLFLVVAFGRTRGQNQKEFCNNLLDSAGMSVYKEVVCNYDSQRNQQDTLWNDDSSSSSYNCDGTVTDAVCCMDHLCEGKNRATCTADGKRSFLCRWNSASSKCVAYRDDENNVCCQEVPPQGCRDVSQGLCPEDWQVPEGCCSLEGRKHNTTLLGVKEGYVCCNAPCKELEENNCQLTPKCGPQARSLYANGGVSQYVGFGSVGQHYQPGNIFYGTGYGYPGGYDQKVDNYDQYKDYKTTEITVDDLMDMLITALEKDTDVVEYDNTIYSNPYYGKTTHYNALPYASNYVDPEVFVNKAFSYYGLQGYQGGYGGGYGGHHYGSPQYGYGGGQQYGHGGYGGQQYGSGYGGGQQYGSGYGGGQQYGSGYGGGQQYGSGYGGGQQYGSGYGGGQQYGSGYRSGQEEGGGSSKNP